MKLTSDTRRLLNKLRIILKKACHAEGCDRVTLCPNQCGCRTRRPFKLNTETSICWEIADRIWIISRDSTPYKSDVDNVAISIDAYYNLGRFHMSRGWEKCFKDVAACYREIIEEQNSVWKGNGENSINNLGSRVNRLKRYPRETDKEKALRRRLL